MRTKIAWEADYYDLQPSSSQINIYEPNFFFLPENPYFSEATPLSFSSF